MISVYDSSAVTVHGVCMPHQVIWCASLAAGSHLGEEGQLEEVHVPRPEELPPPTHSAGGTQGQNPSWIIPKAAFRVRIDYVARHTVEAEATHFKG
jgi:hypothetical protein